MNPYKIYIGISRLLQLAYPGGNALNDRDLEYEALKRDPTSLQEAANYAIKLEAYWQSLTAGTTVSAKRGSGRISQCLQWQMSQRPV